MPGELSQRRREQLGLGYLPPRTKSEIDTGASAMVPTRDMPWSKGVTGTVHTHHRGDNCSAGATLIHDSPPDQETVEVVLLEDYYCCSAGEIIEAARRQFKPD